MRKKMGMGDIDELKDQQNEWDQVINKTEKLKEETLKTMLRLRKEISSLSQLKKKFPESRKIDDRMIECDKLLEDSTEILNDINKKLPEFQKQKEALEPFIKKYSESTESQPDSLKP
ncbi:hypothetical protein [Legionella spiritensis]|nr:hypothetical protein [Legionella spiritensis]